MNGTRWFAGCLALNCLGWIAPCPAASPLADILACRALVDTTARLACFDRETARLDARADAAVPPVRPATPVDPIKQFGLPERSIEKQEVAAGTRADASKIEAHIAQLSQTANGRAVFTLDNDQVWRQLLADVDVLAKKGDAVTISRGLFASYWLETAHGRGCKVTRVR